MPVSVLTQHNDNIRSGANLQETKLNTSNIDVNTFGLIASREVEGEIYAQVLYVPKVAIGGIPRNVVYAATMENWVYAFDADDLGSGATFLWKRQVAPGCDVPRCRDHRQDASECHTLNSIWFGAVRFPSMPRRAEPG